MTDEKEAQSISADEVGSLEEVMGSIGEKHFNTDDDNIQETPDSDSGDADDDFVMNEQSNAPPVESAPTVDKLEIVSAPYVAGADATDVPEPEVYDDPAEYRCHKVVRAMQISARVGNMLSFEGNLSDRAYGENWLAKHEVEVGGYIVIYEDGYKSFSPQDVFEAGYTKIED